MNELTQKFYSAILNNDIEECKNQIINVKLHEITSFFCMTFLHIAVYYKRLVICKLLIEHGAPINVYSQSGRTPLMESAQNGEIDICKLLLEHGAIVNDTCNNNCTALYLASIHGHIDICKLLLEYASDPTICDRHGRSCVDVSKTEDIYLLLCGSGNKTKSCK